jgi:DNA-binding NtrC family response regulator
MRGFVSRLLKREGYQVLSAEGPRQALEIVTTPPPVDLVVSDIDMPEKPGTQLVREIAQLSPQTACVLVTGGATNMADVPADMPVLKKPFAKEDLISVIQAALEQSAQVRADLRCERDKTAELLRQTSHLHAETAETIRRAREILNRCVREPKKDQ